MKARGGSFGLVITVVVMGIVLLLVAKNWETIAPTLFRTGEPADVGELAETQAEVDSETLPNLDQARQTTDDHASDVADALAATE